MKSNKKFFYLKKINFQLFKVFLWMLLGYLFIGFSFIIPTFPNNFIKEFVVVLVLAIVVNINVSFLLPKLKKINWKTLIIISSSIFLCVFFEMFLFFKNFEILYTTQLISKKFFFTILGYILLRDLSIFLFFCWVESYNWILLLFNEKEKIHQQEISLLTEKREFEKKYARNKILPHYFFNILEHVYIKSLISESYQDIFDKVKFVLYYFLVDTEKEVVDLEKELEFYKYYIDLEMFRHKEKISIEFNIVGKPEEFEIVPLIFEPLIGNALKHTKQDGTGWVDIKVDVTQFPIIIFQCKNNYIPHISNFNSLEKGLAILKQRLYLCYNNKHSLFLSQSNDFYEVKLTIFIR